MSDSDLCAPSARFGTHLIIARGLEVSLRRTIPPVYQFPLNPRVINRNHGATVRRREEDCNYKETDWGK